MKNTNPEGRKLVSSKGRLTTRTCVHVSVCTVRRVSDDGQIVELFNDHDRHEIIDLIPLVRDFSATLLGLRAFHMCTPVAASIKPAGLAPGPIGFLGV